VVVYDGIMERSLLPVLGVEELEVEVTLMLQGQDRDLLKIRGRSRGSVGTRIRSRL